MSAIVDMKRSRAFAGVVTATLGATAALPLGAMITAAFGFAAVLKSHHTAVAALFVFLLLRIGSPALIQAPQGLELVAWAGVLLACGRVWAEALRRRTRLTAAIPASFFAYAAVLIPLSVLISTSPAVSAFKALSFAAVTSSICLGFHLAREDGRPASSWIKGFWLAVVVLSVPTLAIPSIGYLRDGYGFQGVLNHPQALAVFLAPVVAWSAVQALSTEGRGRVIVISLFLMSFGFLWLTRGRTGLAAIALSAIVLMLLRPGFFRSAAALGLRALSKTWIMVSFVLLVPLVLWKAPEIAAGLQEFLLKGSGAGDVAEAAAASRGFIVDQQILNFQSSPIFGIGFGVSNSATHTLNVVIDPITGLPVGAATEKANLFLAVIEETGVVGALAFVPFFLALILRLARTSSLAVSWAALAALGTNLAEMTFFSMGGVGLYTWLIMGWALSDWQKVSRSTESFSRPRSGAMPSP